ncbi:fatty acid desaturase-domain-containing protein [Suillus spraguei]|nr:fatty acid desaturase-domain-containing protein [Suillus spraguei]
MAAQSVCKGQADFFTRLQLLRWAESFTEGKRSPRRTTVVSPSEQDDGEPHRSRRMVIMKAHPEVTKLMGYEPLTKYVVLAVVALQLYLAMYLRHSHPLFRSCSLRMPIKGINANKALAVFANLPIGVPYFAAFKKYHIEHHKHLGEDGIDTTLPTNFELLCLNNVLGKTFFATFQIFFYALRPGFVRMQTPTRWHLYNVIVQLLFNYVLVRTFGIRPLLYLLFSSFFAGSLHPCAGHFIAEHYIWDGLNQETYSYYGPLNILAYNVGYHNEHHDFPSIPWTRLPALRALAPEFYDILPSHPSWPMVIVNFIRDKEVGIFARAKRIAKNNKPKHESSSSSIGQE